MAGQVTVLKNGNATVAKNIFVYPTVTKHGKLAQKKR
jgi:hypothetical protein